jgi:hypothetical protein
MRTLTSTLLAGLLVVGTGAARAEDKVIPGAKSVAKTAAHGTTGVGKGVSRIYHNGAHAVHKLIAKNSKSDTTKAKHLQKAAIHYKHADRKEKEAKKELRVAGDHADQIGK